MCTNLEQCTQACIAGRHTRPNNLCVPVYFCFEVDIGRHSTLRTAEPQSADTLSSSSVCAEGAIDEAMAEVLDEDYPGGGMMNGGGGAFVV